MATVSGYDTHAEIVLGGCLRGNRQETEKVLFGAGLLKADMPPRNFYPEIYDGIITTLKDPQQVPTPETVWVNTGRKVPLVEIQSMVEKAENRGQDALISSARMVISLADRTATHAEINKALGEIVNESIPTQDVKSRLMSALAKSRGEIQPADTRSIRERVEAKLGQGDLDPIETYIEWFKFKTNGGFRSRRLFAIAGPEKSRKTTLARNLILSLARKATMPADIHQFQGRTYEPRKDVSIAFLAYENDQETTWMDFVAMIAMELLWKDGFGRSHVHEQIGSKYFHELLNPEKLLTGMDNGKFKKWPGMIQIAVEMAMDMMDTLPLYIYDMNPQNGGLVNDDDMTRVLNMHHALHDAKHKVACVDYVGLVQTPGRSLYEGQTEVVARLLHAANALDYSVLALAQYSRGYQRDNEGGSKKKKSKTVGTDNSPALERSCHNYWEVTYDEEHPQRLNVKQTRARRGAGGNQSGIIQYWIHPDTGQILDEYSSNTKPLETS